jgi:acyl-[acyl carrier protein]--UDP-N-acetylglucosamine O-acyltransferase
VVGNVKIGSGTRLHSNVIIGFPAQNIGTQKSLGSIEIGKNGTTKNNLIYSFISGWE